MERYKSYASRLFLGIFLSFTLLQAANIKDIKGTYYVLNDEYHDYSPVHGAVWWETGVVKKYYHAGSQDDATVKLIKMLFNAVQGNFDITNSPMQPAYHLSPYVIGAMIATIDCADKNAMSDDELQNRLHTLISNDESFKQSINQFVPEQTKVRDELTELQARKKMIIDTYKDELGLLKARIVQQLGEKLKMRQLNKAVAASVESLEELLKPFLVRAGTPLKNDIKDLIDLRRDIAQKKHQLDKAYYTESDCDKQIDDLQKKLSACDVSSAQGKRLKQLINYIVTSRHEEQSVPKITQTILLTCAYRKAHNKKDLRDYLYGLNAVNNQAFLTAQGETTIASQQWEEDRFNESEVEATLEQANKDLWSQDGFDQKMLDKVGFDVLIYAEIMNKFYAESLPKFAQYRRASFQGISFPDCFETTVRNLCNTAIFDQRSGLFSLQKARELSSGSHLDAGFEAFYAQESNANATNVENSSLYQEWSDIMQNKPFVIYNNIVTKDVKKRARFPHGTAGFIYGLNQKGFPKTTITDSSFKQVTLHSKNYIIVDPKKYSLYEARPSLRNVIVLINEFFGLNLFKNLDAAYKEKDFCEKYFGQLCNKLNLTCSNLQGNSLTSKDLVYPGMMLKMKKIHCAQEFSMHLEPGHGYLNTQSKKSSIEADDINRLLLLLMKRNEMSDSNVTDLCMLSKITSINNELTINSTKNIILSDAALKLELFKKMSKQENLFSTILQSKNKNNVRTYFLDVAVDFVRNTTAAISLKLLSHLVSANIVEIYEISFDRAIECILSAFCTFRSEEIIRMLSKKDDSMIIQKMIELFDSVLIKGKNSIKLKRISLEIVYRLISVKNVDACNIALHYVKDNILEEKEWGKTSALLQGLIKADCQAVYDKDLFDVFASLETRYGRRCCSDPIFQEIKQKLFVGINNKNNKRQFNKLGVAYNGLAVYPSTSSVTYA